MSNLYNDIHAENKREYLIDQLSDQYSCYLLDYKIDDPEHCRLIGLFERAIDNCLDNDGLEYLYNEGIFASNILDCFRIEKLNINNNK